ncbi:hypothetical protein AQUCO_03500230v1 [Aquilegia coerulea]|uniref:Uncharacterized protein n=1 Tax=Aquilegia coerulea TaxID=218851 RepID=A0A2G5CWU1_AQUCA|nr:hypothetical protein AQUCO_03500230v1 [Aquilegia coerulea]
MSGHTVTCDAHAKAWFALISQSQFLAFYEDNQVAELLLQLNGSARTWILSLDTFVYGPDSIAQSSC